MHNRRYFNGFVRAKMTNDRPDPQVHSVRQVSSNDRRGLSFELATPIANRGRNPVIDQLKGFAMFLILVYHGGGILGIRNIWKGQVGVDIFLVVSGYSLALGSLDLRWDEYFKKRFFRIFPKYWAALALFIALAYWVSGSVPSLPILLLHLFGLHGFANGYTLFYWADSLWYIGLIVPLYFLVFLIRRWTVRVDVLLAISGAASVATVLYAVSMGDSYHNSYVSIPMRIPMFFAGVAAGGFAIGKTMRLAYSPWLLIGGGCIYYLLVMLNQSFDLGIAALGLIAAWIAFGKLAAGNILGRWFLDSFAYLGVISYEIYLFHQPLMREYNRLFLAYAFKISNPTRSQLYLGMMTVLCGLVAITTLWKTLRAGTPSRRAQILRPALSLLALILVVAELGVLELNGSAGSPLK